MATRTRDYVFFVLGRVHFVIVDCQSQNLVLFRNRAAVLRWQAERLGRVELRVEVEPRIKPDIVRRYPVIALRDARARLGPVHAKRQVVLKYVGRPFLPDRHFDLRQLLRQTVRPELAARLVRFDRLLLWL